MSSHTKSMLQEVCKNYPGYLLIPFYQGLNQKLKNLEKKLTTNCGYAAYVDNGDN
ncbi:MAG: hypothetical protein KGY44_07165 [Halanaerobiales bacterium]|nr:hypothetical protein [Halanaerobiales bacterium]